MSGQLSKHFSIARRIRREIKDSCGKRRTDRCGDLMPPMHSRFSRALVSDRVSSTVSGIEARRGSTLGLRAELLVTRALPQRPTFTRGSSATSCVLVIFVSPPWLQAAPAKREAGLVQVPVQSTPRWSDFPQYSHTCLRPPGHGNDEGHPPTHPSRFSKRSNPDGNGLSSFLFGSFFQ